MSERPVCEPSTEEILAEVERRRAVARPAPSERTRALVIALDRVIFWVTKHWAAILNGIALAYVGLPFVAPVLMLAGADGAARIIHLAYSPMCHQLPQRSWYLFGPQPAYSVSELLALVGEQELAGRWSRAFIGNPAVGYKVALCQRDVAIYGTICAAGLVYSVLRRRVRIRPLRWWAYVAFGVLPMLVDGGYQWVSYLVAAIWPGNPYIQPHETTPLLRTVTGALFGLATVWLAFPHVEATMAEIGENLRQRFGWQ